MAVDPRDATGAQHDRSDIVARQRDALASDRHVRYARFVSDVHHVPAAVGLVAQEPRVDDVHAIGQFVGYRREHLGGVGTTRDKRRNPSQCGLVFSEDTELVAADFGLPAASIGLAGTQSCQAGKSRRRQGDDEEHTHGHRVRRSDRENAPARLQTMEEDVHGGAGERGERAQTQSPHGRDHQNAQQKDDTEDIPPVGPMSRYTTAVSAARSSGATTRPRARGGAVERNNNRNARARGDVAASGDPVGTAASPTGSSTARGRGHRVARHRDGASIQVGLAHANPSVPGVGLGATAEAG